jgi:hypothetical protein
MDTGGSGPSTWITASPEHVRRSRDGSAPGRQLRSGDLQVRREHRADPYRWVPEAARLVRTGGRLMFLVNRTILNLCALDAEEPATDRLVRSYFGLHRLEWSTDASVNFCLGYGDWIRLLRSSGFDVEDLVELRPATGATTDDPCVTLAWARQWPSEEVWKARKRG